jgi:hypothetical protein
MTSYWMLESPRELGFIKGDKYWVQGYTWMQLDKIERTLIESNGSTWVTYHFVGCAP